MSSAKTESVCRRDEIKPKRKCEKSVKRKCEKSVTLNGYTLGTPKFRTPKIIGRKWHFLCLAKEKNGQKLLGMHNILSTYRYRAINGHF